MRSPSHRAALLFCLLISGCSTFRESFLFVATDTATNKSQYYRVKINGFTFLSSSQYAAGTYDVEAVDSLFGELDGGRFRIRGGSAGETSPGAEASLTDNSGTDDGTAPSQADASEQTLRTLDGKSKENTRLVLFLSSNADAMIKRIKSFATTSKVTQGITQILLKDDIEALEAAKALAPRRDARATTLAKELRATAKVAEAGEGDTLTDPNLEAWFAASLQATARVVDPGASFKTVDEARTWFLANRSKLDSGMGL